MRGTSSLLHRAQGTGGPHLAPVQGRATVRRDQLPSGMRPVQPRPRHSRAVPSARTTTHLIVVSCLDVAAFMLPSLVLASLVTYLLWAWWII